MNSQKLNSEFKQPMTLGIYAIAIFLIGLLLAMVIVWLTDFEEIGVFQRILISFFPMFTLPFILKIEIPKIKQLVIDDNCIIVRSPILGVSRKKLWTDFDGYQTVIHLTGTGTLRELILFSNDKIVLEISENYIKNYSEVKRAITKNLKNLGPIEFNYFGYLKERMLG